MHIAIIPGHGWRVRSGRVVYDPGAAQAAIGAGPGVILHLHVNAGKGDYLMAMHDHRSALGADYAARWCASADRILRPLFRRDVRERPQPSRPDDWTSRAYSLLRGSYAETPTGVAAVLLEPGFVDSESHDGLWTERGVELQARAILDAFK